jgi:hypothetical protein
LPALSKIVAVLARLMVCLTRDETDEGDPVCIISLIYKKNFILTIFFDIASYGKKIGIVRKCFSKANC